MPGIAGIISQRPPEECRRFIKAMTCAMREEAFDISSTHSVPEMGIYTGCVAHRNLSASTGIFQNEQEDILLVLSGECFLDPQIGIELRRNHHNVGMSHASWLVHLYEQGAEQFVRNLNGLFSGLLIDKRQCKAFLFNDRYGMERVYWRESEDGFYFASQAKALMRILPGLRQFDEQGVAQFLACGCTLETRTLFKGISTLPAGSLWSFENGNCERRKYFSPESWESQTPLPIETFEADLGRTFRSVLARYTDSNIPLGISLTAGLDTRMIMACLPETTLNAICYTYSGATDTLDAKLAARVAAACGLEHRILRLGHDFFANFSEWADKTVYATDGYFGISGAHEIYLSRQARDLSPVRLAGIFGGEILRGVSTFKPVGLSQNLLHPQMRLLANEVRVPCINEHSVTFAAFKEIPWNMFGTAAACRSQLCLRSPYLDNELVKLAYRTPVSLRQSCDSAVRFVRNNNKAVANAPTDMGYLGTASGPAAAFNRMAAKLMFKFDYHYSHGLPRSLSSMEPLFRPFAACLQRFGAHRYLHYHRWLQKELALYVKESLTDAQTRQIPFWNKDFVRDMADEHISGRKNYVQEINAVLTISAIERLLFRTLPHESKERHQMPIQDR